jgi:uroporphyrinogen-III decarboxylase
MNPLTSRERVRRAMAHELPDRVPVMCQLALGHYFLFSEFAAIDIWFDSEVFVRALEQLRDRYGFDGVLINLPGRPANWRDYLSSSEQTESSCRLTWKNGLETVIPPDDNPHTFAPHGRPLPRADYTRVNVDDPATYRVGGYVWNTWHAPCLWDIPLDADLGNPAAYPDWFTAGLRAARALCPDVSVHTEVFSPFTHLLELFGYENALLALLATPETCHRLLERLTRHVIAQVQCYAPLAPDAILISSAFAGAGFISRRMYADFVLPYERQVVEAVHAHRLPVYVHTCGAIGDRLDLMSDSGIDGIDTLDPPPLGTVDLAEVKARFSRRFFLKGNLDAVNEMLRADDETFEAAVRERLRIGMPGSGYILSSACSVSPRVSPERLKTMVQLAKNNGQYRVSSG